MRKYHNRTSLYIELDIYSLNLPLQMPPLKLIFFYSGQIVYFCIFAGEGICRLLIKICKSNVRSGSYFAYYSYVYHHTCCGVARLKNFSTVFNVVCTLTFQTFVFNPLHRFLYGGLKCACPIIAFS